MWRLVFFTAGMMISVCCACGTEEPAGIEEESSAPVSEADRKVAEQVLREASLEGRVDLVAASIKEGARVDSADVEGRTALMYAAFNGHTECVRLLLDRGASVGTRENVGRTALMFSSSGPFPETVVLLLEYGANPNDADEYEGWTPLMFAAAEGQIDVIQVLLDHSANPTAVDKDGEVAAEHAANNGHSEVEALLRTAAARR